ncbi:calcium-binding protein [Jannaschia pohangensis]|uniref:Hemolysin-type calcium-binding repeat-containing protein n=1 Tax=Jannaschia pohangensis TaxID=390807 RepID=A0A1I3ID36_9RHOB|nr:calcium-binding protein [Jannaschia pohangensis]SFI45861.1 Hemolysin-type calcium-binding repeat-containing protein [Jannaschia pohangensis]
MNIVGTSGSGALTGTDADDKIIGLAGDDTINGGAGNDRIYGGAGADLIIGGAGNDVIFAGNGGQRGGDGFADVMEFGADDGFDKVYGFEVGVDKIVLTGQGVEYTITFIESTQNTIITYGDTTITVYDVRLTDDDISNPGGIGGNVDGETITGTPAADALVGTNGDDTIVALGDDDVVDGSGGNDFILGNTGFDSLLGGAGDDTLYGGRDDDQVEGGDGNDVLSGDAGSDTLTGGDGDDTFVFFSRHDGVGSDVITDWEAGEEIALIGFGGVFVVTDVDGDSVLIFSNDTESLIVEIEGTTDVTAIEGAIAFYEDNPF